MPSRRQVLIASGALVLVAPLVGRPQGPVPKVPRIGFLEASMPQNGTTRFLEDFRQGFRELDYVGMAGRFRQAQVVASAVGIGVRSVEVRDSGELERALGTMDRERPDALLILADPLTTSQRLRIVEYAAAARLPAMYETSLFV